MDEAVELAVGDQLGVTLAVKPVEGDALGDGSHPATVAISLADRAREKKMRSSIAPEKPSPTRKPLGLHVSS